MGKKALVLCGGGAKGAYQVGAYKALLELGFKPDIVTGTSVGALNGAFIVSGDFNKAYSVWSNINMAKIFSFNKEDLTKVTSMTNLVKFLIKSKDSASYEPLLSLINQNIDEDKIRKSNIDFGFVTTQFMPLKKVEMFKEDIPLGQMNDYIMASAACYPYMKSYSIGSKKYIDGGYFDNMPIEMAIKKGATEIVVIDLNAIGKTNTYINMPAKITYISSRHDLGGLLMFDENKSLKNIKLGYYDTMKTFNLLEGDLYTFKRKSNILSSKYEDRMNYNYNKIFSGLPDVSPFEKIAQNSIKEYLEKYNRELFTINSNVLTSLEFAANIFDIDMLNVYSFKQLSKLVMKKVNVQKKNNDYKNLFNLKSIIKKMFRVDSIKDITDSYDKKNLVCYVTDLLNKDMLSFDDKKEIWIFSSLMPDVVLSAIFISSYLTKEKISEKALKKIRKIYSK